MELVWLQTNEGAAAQLAARVDGEGSSFGQGKTREYLKAVTSSGDVVGFGEACPWLGN